MNVLLYIPAPWVPWIAVAVIILLTVAIVGISQVGK
jgi:hypothetical protein